MKVLGTLLETRDVLNNIAALSKRTAETRNLRKLSERKTVILITIHALFLDTSGSSITLLVLELPAVRQQEKFAVETA